MIMRVDVHKSPEPLIYSTNVFNTAQPTHRVKTQSTTVKFRKPTELDVPKGLTANFFDTLVRSECATGGVLIQKTIVFFAEILGVLCG